MSMRMRNLDPQFNLSQMARLIKAEVDKEVDSSNCFAYASVVNMKMEGTLGDERAIAVQFSPAVVKRRASATLPLGRRTHGFGLLDLDRQGHLKVLEYLKPDWVREEGEGEGGRGCLVSSGLIWHLENMCLFGCPPPCLSPPRPPVPPRRPSVPGFRSRQSQSRSPILTPIDLCSLVLVHLVFMHTWVCSCMCIFLIHTCIGVYTHTHIHIHTHTLFIIMHV
jgi:hypothetical protein